MAVTECRSFTTKTKEKQTEIAYPILRYSSNVCRIKSPLVTTESTTESPVNMWFNNSDTVSCLEHTQTHKHATSRSPSPDKTHSGAWETILMGHLMGCCLKTPPIPPRIQRVACRHYVRYINFIKNLTISYISCVDEDIQPVTWGLWWAKGWEQAPCSFPQTWHCSPVLCLQLTSWLFRSIFLYTKTTLQKAMTRPSVTIIYFEI